MSPELIWKNVVAYCMQVGLLIGLAALVPAALRLRVPRARLIYWQILLFACLALPLAQTWQREIITATVGVSSVITAIGPSKGAAVRSLPMTQVALAVLIAGAALRLIWLAVGFWRLWLYRRRACQLRVETPWQTSAEVLISEDVSSPVTFGLRTPIVLVPTGFRDLDRATREAILCHELLHVDRRDWLFTIAEELVRAIFWFHPAIWWLLGEIQLSREQAVDRAVIEMTNAREEYVDALLAIAGAAPRLDLAPAPLFLRKRHLKHRVVSILKEARMSRAGLAAAFSAGLAILAAVWWLAASTFPLAAAPQVVVQTIPPGAPPQALLFAPPAPAERPAEERPVRRERERASRRYGPETPAVEPELLRIRVGGNAQQTKLVQQPRPAYPALAKQARIQGVVKLSAVIDKDGTMQQLDVISGHPLLVPAALEAVKQWVYEPTLLNGSPVEVVTQIDVNFTLSK